jgi:MoaA/NifB/PqqE/SkfB family radical SAM enzyme
MTTKIPFNNIVKLGQKTMLDSNLFSVSWIIGRFCNYKCSYCWPYANTDKPDYYDLKTYKNAIDEIKRQAIANGYDKFHFSFSGGEPTAYKKFLDLVKYYEDYESEYLSIHMTSNCSPAKSWWKRWLDATHVMDRRSITASFHAEFANEKEFGDKLLYLQDEGVLVTINQVMVPEHWEEYYARSKRFIDRGLHVTLKPQSDPTASFVVDGYTDEQKEILQNESEQEYKQVRLQDAKGVEYEIDQAERLNAFGFNKFKGWSCNSGYQSCIIRGNEVKRSYSCHDTPLGTLTDGFKLFDKPMLCITPTCVSSADSKIPKEKI